MKRLLAAWLTLHVWAVGGLSANVQSANSSSAALHLRGDFDMALAEARASGKKLLVLLSDPYNHETPECLALLRRHAFEIGKNAVTVIVIAGQQSYPVELLYTTRFPALFLLTNEEVLLEGPVMCTEKEIEKFRAFSRSSSDDS